MCLRLRLRFTTLFGLLHISILFEYHCPFTLAGNFLMWRSILDLCLMPITPLNCDLFLHPQHKWKMNIDLWHIQLFHKYLHILCINGIPFFCSLVVYNTPCQIEMYYRINEINSVAFAYMILFASLYCIPIDTKIALTITIHSKHLNCGFMDLLTITLFLLSEF